MPTQIETTGPPEAVKGPPTEAELNAKLINPRAGDKYNVGFDVGALLKLAASALKKSDSPRIELIAMAGPNKVFCLSFEDGSEAIARFPYRADYHKAQMSAEISTMIFARQFYNFPVPGLCAWSLEHGSASPVGAPFILMERLLGRTFQYNEFAHSLDEDTKLKILRAISPVHHELMKPLPPSLQRFGVLNMCNLPNTCTDWAYGAIVPEEEFEVRPYFESQKFRKSWYRDGINWVLPATTFDNIAEYWIAAAKLEFLELKRHFSRSLTPEEPYVVDNRDCPTASDLAEVYRNLMALLGHYAHTHDPKHQDFRPCLWHHDLKFDNVLFNPETYEVTGVIDWESATIVPRILSARYPSELEWGRIFDDPNSTTAWRFYSYDYTVAFPSTNDVKLYIDATWYRFFYSGLLANMDAQLSTRFWKESTIALHLYELVQEGFVGWLKRKDWLEETVAKISEASHKD